jgi:hypothetical protein
VVSSITVLPVYLAADKYHMPRLSLYRPERGNDFKFIDRQISEMFAIGGTDFYLHKYIGVKSSAETSTADTPFYTKDGVTPNYDPTQIQDLLLLENRDRKYDSSIYKIRGHYNVQNLDFNLSQFGLFIDNDTVFATVHINDWIQTIGRKPISGDVVELPHLKDEFALNDYNIALPRYFVIEDVSRASEGYSITWWPHLYRLKLKKITDSQQFADILDQPIADANGDPTNQTLREVLSTKGKELEINDAIITQAEADTPLSGYETRQFYTLAIDPTNGSPILTTVDDNTSPPDASTMGLDTSRISGRAVRSGYSGYLLGDGFPPNGYEFGHGIMFPANPYLNDYFLRTDFAPNRLFRYNGKQWVKVEDALRHTLTNTNNRTTQKTSFINNTNVNTINGEQVVERQALSKALKPKADL